MKVVPLAEVKAKLSAYVDASDKEGPVVITRNGRPVADLVPHGAPAGAPTRRKTAGELQEELRRTGPHPDADRWRADLAAEDALWPDDRDW